MVASKTNKVPSLRELSSKFRDYESNIKKAEKDIVRSKEDIKKLRSKIERLYPLPRSIVCCLTKEAWINVLQIAFVYGYRWIDGSADLKIHIWYKNSQKKLCLDIGCHEDNHELRYAPFRHYVEERESYSKYFHCTGEEFLKKFKKA